MKIREEEFIEHLLIKIGNAINEDIRWIDKAKMTVEIVIKDGGICSLDCKDIE